MISPTRHRAKGRRNRLTRRAFVLRLAILGGFLLVWEAVVRLEVVDSGLLAAPDQIVVAAADLLANGEAQAAFARTGLSILLAFLIGTSAGILVACLLGASELLRRAYLSPILFLLSTPKSIFLPIFTLTFGITSASATAFGAFEAFFYVVANVIGGLGLVQSRHLRVADAFGAPLYHRYADVILPSALPGIFAALWYGIKHAFLGVMISQLWASQGGIGDLIRTYSSALKTDYAFAVVLIITVIAVLAGSMWTRVEIRMTRWRDDMAGGAIVASAVA